MWVIGPGRLGKAGSTGPGDQVAVLARSPRMSRWGCRGDAAGEANLEVVGRHRERVVRLPHDSQRRLLRGFRLEGRVAAEEHAELREAVRAGVVRHRAADRIRQAGRRNARLARQEKLDTATARGSPAIRAAEQDVAARLPSAGSPSGCWCGRSRCKSSVRIATLASRLRRIGMLSSPYAAFTSRLPAPR